MPRTIRQIPEWYTQDWSPATARNELSAMRWEDLEAAIDMLISNPEKRQKPRLFVRMLWLESTELTAMDLLQRLLLIMARGLDPAQALKLRASESIIPTPASGALPRWSYTDLEVALSYTWSGMALEIATARHHDCLAFRDERLTGLATARQLFLLVCGLPTPQVLEVNTSPQQEPKQAAAA